MRAGDPPYVRRLLTQCWTETYEDALGPAIAGRLFDDLKQGSLAGLVPNRDETVFLAWDQDDLVGCAVAAERHNVVYLWGFYVLKRFQGQGIGCQLLRQAVGAHDPKTRVELSVLQSSVAAQRFYRSRGFQTLSQDAHDIVPSVIVPAVRMAACVDTILRKSCLGRAENAPQA